MRQLLGIPDQVTPDTPFRGGRLPAGWDDAARRQIGAVNFYDHRVEAGPAVS